MDTVSIHINAIVERVMSKFPARDRTEVVHCLKILKVAIDAKRISPQDFAALTAAMQNGETYPEPILARLLPREAEPIKEELEQFLEAQQLLQTKNARMNDPSAVLSDLIDASSNHLHSAYEAGRISKQENRTLFSAITDDDFSAVSAATMANLLPDERDSVRRVLDGRNAVSTKIVNDIIVQAQLANKLKPQQADYLKSSVFDEDDEPVFIDKLSTDKDVVLLERSRVLVRKGVVNSLLAVANTSIAAPVTPKNAPSLENVVLSHQLHDFVQLGGDLAAVNTVTAASAVTAPSRPPPGEASSFPNKIFVFHDGENCPFHSRVPVRDANGALIRTDDRVQFHSSYPPGLGPIDFHTAYKGIMREALSNFVGRDVSAAINVFKELTIEYNFVLAEHNSSNPFHPTKQVLTALQGLQVKNHHVDDKPHSVDKKIMELLTAAVANVANYTHEAQQQTLFVLLSGDRDFAAGIRQVISAGIHMVIIYSQDAPLNQSMPGYLAKREMAMGVWTDILDESRRVLAEQQHGKSPAASPQRQKVGHTISPLSLTLPKTLFVTHYGLRNLTDALSDLDPDLIVRVHKSKEGNYVYVVYEDESQPVSATVQDQAYQLLKPIVDSIQQDVIQLRGVNPVFLKEDESLRNFTKARRVLNYIPSASPSAAQPSQSHRKEHGVDPHFADRGGRGSRARPGEGAGAGAAVGARIHPADKRAQPVAAMQNTMIPLEVGTVICEHPSAWPLHQVLQYCKFELKVGMNLAYHAQPSQPLNCDQLNCRPGFVRNRLKLYFDPAKTPDVPKFLSIQTRKCLQHQSSSVRFITPDVLSQPPPAPHPVIVNDTPATPPKPNKLPTEAWEETDFEGHHATAILVYFADNEEAKNEVRDLLLSKQRVVCVKHIFKIAKLRLVKNHWNQLQSHIRASGNCDISVEWPRMPNVLTAKQQYDPPHATVTIVCHPTSLETVKHALGSKLASIKTKVISIPANVNKKYGLLSGLISTAKQLMTGEADEEDNDIDAWTIGVEKIFNANAIWRIQCELSHFPAAEGDQEDIDAAVQVLDGIIATYAERECPFTSFRHDIRLDSIAVLKKFGLFTVSKNEQQRNWTLCGPSDKVDEAYRWITEIPTAERMETAHVRAPEKAIFTLLTKRKQFNDQRREFMKARKCTGLELEVGKTYPVNTVFSLRGKHADLVLAVEQAEAAIRSWANGLTRGPLLPNMSPGTVEFLKGEGSNILKEATWKFGSLINYFGSKDDAEPTERAINSSSSGTGRNGYKELIRAIIHETEIRVICGDLLTTPVDVMVNPANGTLCHAAGAARAISQKAGWEMDQEGADILATFANRRIPVGEAVVTGAYGLRCAQNTHINKVVHAVGPVYSTGSPGERTDYKKTILAALVKASENGAQYVSVPLMGAGVFGWPADVAADLMIQTVLEWICTGGKLTRIVFVDQLEAHAAAFLLAIQNWSQRGSINAEELVPAKQHAQTPPQYQWLWESHETKTWVPYDYDQVMQIEAALTNGFPITLRGDVGGRKSDSVHIPDGQTSAVYTVSQKSVRGRTDNNTYEYEQMNSKSKFARPIKRIPFISGMRMHGYEASSSVTEVAVNEYDTPVLASVSIVTVDAPARPRESGFIVIGLADQVHRTRGHVSEGLKNCQQVVVTELSLTAGTSWVDVLNRLRAQLAAANVHVDIVPATEDDNAPHELRTIELRAVGQNAMHTATRIVSDYKITFLMEKRQQDAEVVWPKEWPHDEEYDHSKVGYTLVDLSPESDEFRRVEDEWRGRPGPAKGPQGPRHMFTKRLVKIQRVQNPSAWAAYFYRIRLLADRNKETTMQSESVFVRANEYWMKHGTRTTPTDVIARGEQGIDYRHCEGGMFGRAAYTAEDSAYSDSYRHNLGDGNAHMFLVRVAAGRIFDGVSSQCRNFIKPPEGYDSVRGEVSAGQKAIMVYQTDSTYPAYLITYKP
jgi:O-acetyl-ADP-ribose deacetylase (regulator of RNase III)